ncbi:galactosylceramide sulfotransferase-like isoform X1 [Tachypleus tridentatus]|uniref:galactosylceramide sulfotransferase-like isoform X1 n=1 Tax=Tachypleus tridentatus TaxID=6853 RepID=UPI003FCF2419
MSTDLLMPVMKRGKHTYRQTWILLFLAGLSVLLILFFVNVYPKNIRSVTYISKCMEKKTNVVFLKTHKTGSSSIQNVLMRFGYNQDLLFALPKKGNYFGHPRPFHHAMIPNLTKPVTGKSHYNIFTHHTRFNYLELKRSMPENTVFITILRDPVELFESLYSYYSLNDFYKTPLSHFSVNISEENSDMRFGDKIGRNQMSFDLGLEVKDFENVSVLRDFTVKLNEEFDLVMITEQIDESLILLQNLLCWEIDDVVTFKLNARNEKFIKRLTPSVRLRLQKVNYADQVLYNFFKERLAEKIQNFGRAKLGAKVKELRIRKDFWYNFCVHGETLLINTKGIEKLAYVNPKVTKLKVRKNDTCIKMTEYELTFTEMLRLKQKHLVSYYTGNNS